MSLMALIVLFFEKYLVPFLFAIGLFNFLYGCIEYFIIGEGGDEERAEHGRDLFLRSIMWFLLAIIVHLVLLFFGWIASFDFSVPTQATPDGGVQIERQQDILQIPNAPTR